MKEMINNLIGRGPSFPFNLSLIEGGGLKYTEGLDRINHSLYLLFETPKGSRLMMPNYGSDIHLYKFDPLDQILLEKLRYTIIADINKWEPRITVLNVNYLEDATAIDNNILYISIDYIIISTNVRGNYVHPYKLGTYDTVNTDQSK